MANGTSEFSTHTAKLPHAHLPDSMRTGHILPHLHQPLLSIGKFCDAGCTATFNAQKVTVSHGNKLLLQGTRTGNGLWSIPMTTAPAAAVHTIATLPTCNMQSSSHANFTIHDATLRQTIKFLHLCLFSPTKATLLKAVRNNHFVGWPGFTAQHIQRHLRLEEPTILGHTPLPDAKSLFFVPPPIVAPGTHTAKSTGM